MRCRYEPWEANKVGTGRRMSGSDGFEGRETGDQWSGVRRIERVEGMRKREERLCELPRLSSSWFSIGDGGVKSLRTATRVWDAQGQYSADGSVVAALLAGASCRFSDDAM